MSDSLIVEQADTQSAILPRSRPMVTLTWIGVYLFCVAYFFRPGDFYEPIESIPLAKVAGIFGAVALLAALATGGAKLRKESKVMLLLLGYLIMCVPFSHWRGGSADLIFSTFAKTLLIAIGATTAVITAKRLQRLIYVPIFAMLFLCLMALGQGKVGGRMYGVGNLFGDPNDFALNLCVNLPLCFAFFMASKRPLGKLFWLSTTGLFLFAIISSGSRGGFLALLAVTAAMTRKFSKGVGSAIGVLLLVVVMAGGAIVAVGPAPFVDRMAAIVNPDNDPNGSAQARKEILIRSLKYTAEHPVVGLGPGQFENLEGVWHQTHNTYTQLSAEAGLPALAIFVYLLVITFRNIKSARFEPGSREALMANGIYCAMVGYLVGGFFLSTAYLFFPYLLFAYASSIAQISEAQRLEQGGQVKLQEEEQDPDGRQANAGVLAECVE
jgi:O-antigen ligase